MYANETCRGVIQGLDVAHAVHVLTTVDVLHMAACTPPTCATTMHQYLHNKEAQIYDASIRYRREQNDS